MALPVAAFEKLQTNTHSKNKKMMQYISKTHVG